MRMSAPAPPFHTADMVRALIDEERAWPRYETLYGELVVTPAPFYAHQVLVTELLAELRDYLRRYPAAGYALTSPADVSFGRRDVLVQPDVFVIPRGMHADGTRQNRWDAIRHLRLAIEVVSTSSRYRDRFGKGLLYQRERVEHYWVLDAEQRSAETWTPDADLPTAVRERLVWHPVEAPAPFVFDLAACLATLDATAAEGSDAEAVDETRRDVDPA